MKSSSYIATLIALSFGAAGCGASVSSTPVSSSVESTSNATSTTSATTALSLAVSSSTVVEGGTVTAMASGGVSPYTYYSENPSLGTVNSSTGVFTASSSETGSTTVNVLDSDGNTATASITVSGSTTSTGTTLVITPSATSITAGGTVTFTIAGGTAPYDYLIPVGDGSLSVSGVSTGTTTTYTSSVLDSTDIELEVIDSSSPAQIVYNKVAISSAAGGSGSTFSSYASILTDDMLGITFYNNSSLANPEIALFGTGSKPNETTMFAHTAVSTCGHDSSGDTSSPCTQFVPLTNYSNGTAYDSAYVGTINFTGRSGSGYLTFCVPPNSSGAIVQDAYIMPGSLSGSATNDQFLEMAYTDTKDGRGFLQGTPALSFYTETDTTSSAGYTDVWISNAAFGSSADCSAYGRSTVQVD